MLCPSPHGRDVIKVLRNFYDKRFQKACGDVAGPQKTLTGDIDIAFRALGIIVSASLLPAPSKPTNGTSSPSPGKGKGKKP